MNSKRHRPRRTPKKFASSEGDHSESVREKLPFGWVGIASQVPEDKLPMTHQASAHRLLSTYARPPKKNSKMDEKSLKHGALHVKNFGVTIGSPMCPKSLVHPKTNEPSRGETNRTYYKPIKDHLPHSRSTNYHWVKVSAFINILSDVNHAHRHVVEEKPTVSRMCPRRTHLFWLCESKRSFILRHVFMLKTTCPVQWTSGDEGEQALEQHQKRPRSLLFPGDRCGTDRLAYHPRDPNKTIWFPLGVQWSSIKHRVSLLASAGHTEGRSKLTNLTLSSSYRHEEILCACGVRLENVQCRRRRAYINCVGATLGPPVLPLSSATVPPIISPEVDNAICQGCLLSVLEAATEASDITSVSAVASTAHEYILCARIGYLFPR
ncbi:hypothetical protein F5I97DRAFT_1831997 [Phlebopus sp. FC_14]|nr:hypothetical protein F5I97DRAFT_1831997 [Phlebopus sp. FC_14]